MKKWLFCLAFVLIVGTCQAQDDPEINKLAWHRYVTSNFTILSINDEQGLWMKNNLENIKVWCLTRWGLPDVKFSKECRIFCVPDGDMLSRLFNLSASKSEVRSKDGSIEITAMWLALDDKPARVIPTHLSEVILAEFEQANNFKFPYWATRGISQLNGSMADIKTSLGHLPESNLIDTETLLSAKPDQYLKYSKERQRVFDSQSIAMCLLLRKEFGEVKLHAFLKSCHKSGHATAIQGVLGFKSVSDFDKTFNRYIKGLSKDLGERITPDSYLTIKAVND
ncbi:MAG: hypothetical protein ACO22R_04775 [Chitinophagaceae bacterium]|jgi:hypothetical protein